MARFFLASSICALLARIAGADCPKGCPAKCPAQADVQSPWMKDNFVLNKFWGTYYELAYHDNTQPRGWPYNWNPFAADCMRSVKSPHPNDAHNYKDLFSLNFGFGAGGNAVCDLEFNITEQPGVFMGHWSGSMRPDLHDIANTVVDIGVAENGTYEWSLEFQCQDGKPGAGIAFAAVNFYHRKPLVDKDEFDAMMARLRARGIGWVADVYPGLKMVNQKKCVDHQNYPAKDASPHWCGQKLSLPRNVVV